MLSRSGGNSKNKLQNKNTYAHVKGRRCLEKAKTKNEFSGKYLLIK